MDADGSIQVMWRRVDRADSDPTMRRPYLSLKFSQRSDRDEVLRAIVDSFGGKLYLDSRGYAALVIFGGPAEQVLHRIKKHLVIKRSYAEAVLSLLGEPRKVEVAQAFLKAQRRLRSDPLPNYPSRKWAAGYIDGDGCFSIRRRTGKRWAQSPSSASPTLEIACSDFDSEGVELLQKAFGGSLGQLDNGRRHLKRWTLVMPPSKIKQVAEHFGQYLIVKKAQFDFLLGCARMGHFRDGNSIQAAMKQLKAQPHRLSESSVPALLAGVKDIDDNEILALKQSVMAHVRSLRKR